LAIVLTSFWIGSENLNYLDRFVVSHEVSSNRVALWLLFAARRLPMARLWRLRAELPRVNLPIFIETILI
jgi:hypothetical protein